MRYRATPILLSIVVAAVVIVASPSGERSLARADAAPTSAALPPPESLLATPTPLAVATTVPLDEETLSSLAIVAFASEAEPTAQAVGSLDTTVQVWPGTTVKLALGVFECCYFFEPVAARARWSVAPAEGATIDAATGLLTIDEMAPNGSMFTVSADVEEGRHVVAVDVHVFTPEMNPLVGLWREEAQLACGTGAEVVPEELIGEMIFDADGTFGVTWFPFEVYQDYWGSYTFDLALGTIDLVVEGGNYTPPDVDGEGRFAFDSTGRLILTEFWLGVPQNGTEPANCGHRFHG